jgi:PAS domain S-box-containing protein
MSLDELLSHTHDGVFVIDKERRYILFNNACEKLTGYSAGEVLGETCGCVGITHCEDEQGQTLHKSLCPGWTVMQGEAPSARQRIRISTRGGDRKWVETYYTAVTNGAGRPECVIGVMRDVTEAKEREEKWAETTKKLRQEVDRLRGELQSRYGFSGIVTQSPRMQEVLERIQSACSNSAPVLITGENGTGKETVARAIHFNGLQKEGPFVALNCSGTSREMLEGELFGYKQGSFAGASQDYAGLYLAAHKSTLFLDEIGALPTGTQAKLLRTMQERSVTPFGSVEPHSADVRVIAATNRSPGELVASGKLREDLFYRLSVITIDLPPLRSRKEDIPFLVDHFIREFNRHGTREVQEIEPGVWPVLESHDWPGNVRELQNTIETALVKGSGMVLRADDVSGAVRGRTFIRDAELENSPIVLDDMLADIERRTILAALRRARGQRSQAAKLMGISRSRLYRRMDALGIVPREEKL